MKLPQLTQEQIDEALKDTQYDFSKRRDEIGEESAAEEFDSLYIGNCPVEAARAILLARELEDVKAKLERIKQVCLNELQEEEYDGEDIYSASGGNFDDAYSLGVSSGYRGLSKQMLNIIESK